MALMAEIIERADGTVRASAQAEWDRPVLVNTCSEAARSFYLRNGFQEVGGQPTVIGGSTHWWMAFPAQTHLDVPVKY